MEGNGYIPFSLFAERAAELPSRVPGLRLSKLEPFGAFSYLLTGGFQPVGLPAGVIRSATWVEARLPKLVMDRLALRVFVVLEKQAV